jgi:hypothetical protein
MNRLLAEELIADGIQWMQRFEAVNRLLAHPMVGIDALSTLRAIVDDRSVQSMVGTSCLFDASAEPQASREVVRHMREPSDERVFKGALMACVRKLSYGQFTGPQLTTLSGLVATTLLERDHLDDETRALAVSVLRQLPRQSHGSLGRSMLQQIARERFHISVLEENRLLDRAGGRLVADRIAACACARTPTAWEGYVDRVLPILIDEMLFDPVFDARLYAACLIHASPFRPAVADALTTELPSALSSSNLARVTAIFEALRKLGGQPERIKVEQFVTGRGVPGSVADAAAYALGHIGGTSDDSFWCRALMYHQGAWQRSASPVSGSILDRLVYALGMSGSTPLLKSVLVDHRMPPRVRACAEWWLRQPEIIRQSART